MTKKNPVKKKKAVKKKKEVHPVSGLTDVQERQRCKDAMRQVWRKTSRVKHIKEVRFPHPDPNSKFTFAVRCDDCGAIFGQSEKVRYKTNNGRYRRTGVYHVDHICDGLSSVKDLTMDLGTFAEELLHTPLRILCVPCHKIVTSMQAETKFGKK